MAFDYPLTPVEGRMPSIDSRNEPTIRVIDGRNYLFDSKGPKSGFGSWQLDALPIGGPRDAQTVQPGDSYFLCTDEAILLRRWTTPLAWQACYYFSAPLSTANRGRWTGKYFAGKYCLNHPGRGFFTAQQNAVANSIVMTKQTDEVIPGLVTDAQAIAIARGRLILVTPTLIQWSASGNLTTMVPAEFGAGFQSISDYSPGTGIGVTSFRDGFIAWTTEGGVAAEYRDNAAVWEFYALRHDEAPLNSRCILTLSTGQQIILTRRGLFVVSGASQIQPWGPEFGEFLRKHMNDNNAHLDYWRLEYDSIHQIVYVLESVNGESYTRAWAWQITTDKWGEYNEQFEGLGMFGPNHYGAIKRDGMIEVFDSSLRGRQGVPAAEDGLDLRKPRIEKHLPSPSSSVVSNNSSVFDEVVSDYVMPTPRACAWFQPTMLTPAPPTWNPLDSFIEIGYFRVPSQLPTSEQQFEIQALTLSHPRSAPPDAEHWSASWQPEFTIPTEDWAVSAEDDEDWNDEGEAEDWDGIGTSLQVNPYEIEIHGSIDGITVDTIYPELSKFAVEGARYTGLSTGVLHSVRISALQQYATYHLSYARATIEPKGNDAP